MTSDKTVADNLIEEMRAAIACAEVEHITGDAKFVTLNGSRSLSYYLSLGIDHFDHPHERHSLLLNRAAQACAAVAAKRIEELEAANSNLRGGLETAAKTFRRYGELHRAKGTTEGNLKASNNDDLAEFCESVIADSVALSHRTGG
jgi:hypothetical protein